jgi:hypothetical protein
MTKELVHSDDFVFGIKLKEAGDQVFVILFDKNFERSLRSWVTKDKEPNVKYLSAAHSTYVTVLAKTCSELYKIEPKHCLFKRPAQNV